MDVFNLLNRNEFTNNKINHADIAAAVVLTMLT